MTNFKLSDTVIIFHVSFNSSLSSSCLFLIQVGFKIVPSILVFCLSKFYFISLNYFSRQVFALTQHLLKKRDYVRWFKSCFFVFFCFFLKLNYFQVKRLLIFFCQSNFMWISLLAISPFSLFSPSFMLTHVFWKGGRVLIQPTLLQEL